MVLPLKSKAKAKTSFPPSLSEFKRWSDGAKVVHLLTSNTNLFAGLASSVDSTKQYLETTTN